VSVLISGDRESSDLPSHHTSPFPLCIPPFLPCFDDLSARTGSCQSPSASNLADARLSAVASPMPLYTGFIQLGAGLSVGLAGLAAGFAIGIVGDAGVRGTAQQPRLFVGMVSRARPPSDPIRIVGCGREARLIMGLDPYPHFRRGARALWAYRGAYPEHQLER